MTQTSTAPAPQGSTAIAFGYGNRAKVSDAAGVLLRYTDEFGTWMLLTQRAHFLSFAGTWANPGGSIDEGEEALTAALRELEEELGVKAADLSGSITKVVETRNYKRSYTTFVIDLDEDSVVVPRTLPAETAAVEWVLDEHINDPASDMVLHPGFAEVYKAIR